jgi:hypothetical protein
MQSQERDLIEGLFGRLKEYESQPRDPEADRLIASLIAAQPGAPYLLTQTVLVQEQALKSAQARIAELEAKAAAAPPPSFLGSAPRIGPWGAAPGAAPASAPPSTPFQQAAIQQPQQGFGGGGFLRSALTTAAGVAGGALLFEGIRNMMGGHNAGPWAPNNLAPNNLTSDTSGLPTGGLPADSPLMPPDNISSADLAQDDLAQDGGAADDYDTSSNDSGFDDSSSDV